MLKRSLMFLIVLTAGIFPLTGLAEDLLIDDFAGGMSARAEARLGGNPKYRTLNWEKMVAQVGAAPIGGARHYSSLIFEGNALTVSTERIGRDWFLVHRADPETRGASVITWDASSDASRRSERGLSEFIPPLKHITHLIVEDLAVEIPSGVSSPLALKVSLYDVDDPKGDKALVATMLLTSSTAISRIPIATAEFKPEDPDAGSFSGNIAAMTLTIDGGALKGVQVRIGSVRIMGPELGRYITDKGTAASAETVSVEIAHQKSTTSRLTPIMPAAGKGDSEVEATPAATDSLPEETSTEVPTETATFSPVPTKVSTAAPSPTVAPSLTATSTPTATGTASATVTQAPTIVPSATAMATIVPSSTPTASFTATPLPTATATHTVTFRAMATDTTVPTPVPAAPTKTARPTATVPVPTATRTSSPTATASHTFTSTVTRTATALSTATKTPKMTATPKVAPASPTQTPSPTGTATAKGTPFYGRCARNLDGKIVCVKFPGEGISECSVTRDCDPPTPTPSPTITLTPLPTATPAQSCICACRAQSGSRELVCVEPWVFRVARLGYSCIDQERGTFPWSFERDAGAVPVERSATYCQDRWNGKEGAGYPDYSTRAPGVPCVLEQCREGVLRAERR